MLPHWSPRGSVGHWNYSKMLPREKEPSIFFILAEMMIGRDGLGKLLDANLYGGNLGE